MEAIVGDGSTLPDPAELVTASELLAIIVSMASYRQYVVIDS